MLRYLYTGEIEFAPWGSTERRRARSFENISESYGIPKASPKSVYRLADKVIIYVSLAYETRTDAIFSTASQS